MLALANVFAIDVCAYAVIITMDTLRNLKLP
ncbi:hypothetical protein MED121_12680 [Marinomonas sp. MED121]|nr:hypothetical protein MED121_12680 [Marinomonas sp. MED121]